MSDGVREGVDYIVDYYALAGVERDAERHEIQRALGELASQYHPDGLEGRAPEILDTADRMTRLLNTARAILTTPEKRREYDTILDAWDGPISRNGVPQESLQLQRQYERKLQGKTPEEIEQFFTEQAQKLAASRGYSPSRLTFLESLLAAQAGGGISDALRVQYEAALLERDLLLALEEAERSALLGLPDIAQRQYAATLTYGEDVLERLAAARVAKKEQLQRQALGGVSAKLALLSGEDPEVQVGVVVESATSLELPAYFDDQAAKVKEIAQERETIADKRLSNLMPTFPESELQREPREDILIGMKAERGTVWFAVKIDTTEHLINVSNFPEEMRPLLEGGDYKPAILKGYGLILVDAMEHVDDKDLIGAVVDKYFDSHPSQVKG